MRIHKVLLLIFVLIFEIHHVMANLENDPSIPTYIDLAFLFFIVLIGTIIRQIIAKLNVGIPCEGLIILVGLVWGIAAYYNSHVRVVSKIVYINTHEVLYIYFPVVIFNMVFCLDSVLFVKTFPLILIIGIPVAVLTGCIFGCIMSLAYSSWSVIVGIMFGTICMPLSSPRIIYLLKTQSAKTKQICVILEGEAIFTIIIAYISYNLVLSKLHGFVEHWYQFVAIITRFVVLGCLVGYLFGILGRYLIRKMYTNYMSILAFSFAMPFFTYLLSDLYLSGCGAISVAIMGAMMSVERAALSKDADKYVTNLWHTITFIYEIILCAICSIFIVLVCMDKMTWKEYVLLVITYLMYYIVRFVLYLIFTIMLKNVGYYIDAKVIFVCVLSGIKCPFSIIVVRTTIRNEIRHEILEQFLFYIMGFYLLSAIINGALIKSLIKFLGLTRISIAKQINMNICMRHIFAKREKTIAILKMDRFLVDTNWSLVIEATNIQHPYKAELETEEEDNFLTHHLAQCPDCNKEVQPEPTLMQMMELTKDAKLRILKAKKMSYSRQFENGMISKEGIRNLILAVDIAIDSEEAEVQLAELEKKFTSEDWLRRFIRKRVQLPKKGRGTTLRVPRKFFRRWCHSVVLKQTWEMYMLWPIFCNIILYGVDLMYFSSEYEKVRPVFFDTTAYISILMGKIFFFLLYFSEFIMKIMAYSWYYIWKHGFYTYFRSFWNITDFIVLILLAGDLIFEFKYTIDNDIEDYFLYRPMVEYLKWFRAIRLLRVIEIGYPIFLKFLDKKFDAKLAFSYELGKSYVTGETEVLELLPYMIDNFEVRDEIKKKIENDKIFITRLLSTVQKEKPWVAITVKTKQAIRTILKSMNETINQLKTAGWVDPYEQSMLETAMFKLYRKVNAIKTVQPSTPKIIFREVRWMAAEESLINFLFDHVTVKKFEPGDVVFGDGILADGIYIVVTGLFSLYYNPEKSVLLHRQKYGQLPIVDYLTSTKCDEPFMDYIVSGNCIGEHSILTRRPYNCTITADAHSQVYFISYEVLKHAMNISSDPINGLLECRIWKEVGIRIAVPLLLSVPSYQNYTQEEIKYTLERGFVPNLSKFKTFSINDVVEDIILIEGVVKNFHSEVYYIAPCYIPRTVQKLIFASKTITKLLVIPEKDLDAYDVMAVTEEAGELVGAGSQVQCLQHAARARIKIKKKSTSTVENKHIRKLTSYIDTNRLRSKDEIEAS